MSQVGFNVTPANIKVPFFYAEFGAGSGGGVEQQNSLIIANTITAQPAVPVWCPTVAQAIALFGSGSIAAAMVEKYQSRDPAGALYVLPMADNGAAVVAAGSISTTGTATAAGVLALYIAGKSIPVAVTVGMTGAQLATAVVAAITAWKSSNGVTSPVSSVVDGTTATKVNLTAKNGGTQGNSIDVRLNYFGVQGGESTPAGITVAIVAMSAGAADPDITGLDAILGDVNYDFIAIPWSTPTQLNAVQTLMSDASGRWSFNRQDYGHVWAAKMDADATGATDITFGLTRNDRHVTVVSYEPSPPPPWEVAADYMAGAAPSLRADPLRPLQTLALPELLAPPKTGRYTWATKNTLLSSGMALMDYNPDGTCKILRAVTTYQKNAAGVPDSSYLDAETLYGLMAFVRGMKAAVATAFPRAKLADDGTNFGAGTTFTNGLPDQPITTPNGIRAVLISQYSRFVDAGLVEDVETFSRGLIVQRNTSDASRVDILLDPVMVSGLRVVAVLIDFFLSDAAALAA